MSKPWEYEDIVHLPHHVSDKHPHMSMADRAAQFSPFAALTGYSAAIADAALRSRQQVEASEKGITEEELFLQEQAGQKE